MPIVETALAPAVKAKVAALIKKIASFDKVEVPIDDLPRELREAGVLAAADRAGLIEFGMRESSTYATFDEAAWKRGDKTYARARHAEGGWSFCSLTGPKRQTVAQFLAESDVEKDARFKAHVRLTNDGQIAAAD